MQARMENQETEYRRQETEDGGRKAEDNGRRAEERMLEDSVRQEFFASGFPQNEG